MSNMQSTNPAPVPSIPTVPTVPNPSIPTVPTLILHTVRSPGAFQVRLEESAPKGADAVKAAAQALRQYLWSVAPVDVVDALRIELANDRPYSLPELPKLPRTKTVPHDTKTQALESLASTVVKLAAAVSAIGTDSLAAAVSAIGTDSLAQRAVKALEQAAVALRECQDTAATVAETVRDLSTVRVEDLSESVDEAAGQAQDLTDSLGNKASEAEENLGTFKAELAGSEQG